MDASPEYSLRNAHAYAKARFDAMQQALKSREDHVKTCKKCRPATGDAKVRLEGLLSIQSDFTAGAAAMLMAAMNPLRVEKNLSDPALMQQVAQTAPFALTAYVDAIQMDLQIRVFINEPNETLAEIHHHMDFLDTNVQLLGVAAAIADCAAPTKH
jgi:hypothetical protein